MVLHPQSLADRACSWAVSWWRFRELTWFLQCERRLTLLFVRPSTRFAPDCPRVLWPLAQFSVWVEVAYVLSISHATFRDIVLSRPTRRDWSVREFCCSLWWGVSTLALVPEGIRDRLCSYQGRWARCCFLDRAQKVNGAQDVVYFVRRTILWFTFRTMGTY